MPSSLLNTAISLPCAELLNRAREDGDSLADLLELFRPWLESLADDRSGMRLRGKVTRSEIAQIVIISANETFEQFRGTNVNALYSWLAQILEHRIADQARQFIKAQARSIDRETHFDGELPCPLHRPSQIVSNREEIARLLAGISALPEPMRKVVQLRYVDDLSFDKIAVLLGVPESTVRRRWHEALQMLKKNLV